jgi:hypothetical protein
VGLCDIHGFVYGGESKGRGYKISKRYHRSFHRPLTLFYKRPKHCGSSLHRKLQHKRTHAPLEITALDVGTDAARFKLGYRDLDEGFRVRAATAEDKPDLFQ